MEQGKNAIALIMDQSMAYDLVDHQILVKKLEAIGLDPNSTKLMKSYLENRQQSVYLEGYNSYPLTTGPRSVVQGSGLSCILFLIFTLDLPLIFYEEKITIQEIDDSTSPDSTTYIDDNFVMVKEKPNEDLQTTLNNTIDKIEKYININLLSLNRGKTQLMVLSKKI